MLTQIDDYKIAEGPEFGYSGPSAFFCFLGDFK